MRHIRFAPHIDTYHRRLPFFLATEEWVAYNLPADEYFFCWQVDPTVICGRNQEINKEVDLDYCSNNGIDVVRRRSGGGAVFADRENFMFSYITPGDQITTEFAHYTAIIAQALQNLGIDAQATGRNDITINGKKVAGNAFYHIPGRCIAHGTMLYNFDSRHIAGALTPSRAKLESKGVKSVPSRVTCLCHEGIQLTTRQFEEYMINSITQGEPYTITDTDLKEILRLEALYYDPKFMKITQPQQKAHRITNTRRIPGIGEFNITLSLDEQQRIRTIDITGDFLAIEDISNLTTPLLGTPYTPGSITQIAQHVHLTDIIPGLTPSHLLTLLFPTS
ncbi:MAG: lipoyltransferase [Muribaculaceae bacterium]|nr:lipoyltransferase [Muribaculaceae bacterium]